jgi:hypothetical protein
MPSYLPDSELVRTLALVVVLAFSGYFAFRD